MFNLEQAVAQWRKQMAAAGVKIPVPLNELENHLRESVEEQMRSGLSAEQAFAVASRQIGSADILNSEFEKNTVKERWGEKWGQKWAGPIFKAALAFYLAEQMFVLFHTTSRFNERALGLAALGATILTVYAAWRLVPRCFPAIINETMETSFIMVSVVSGMGWYVVYAFFILPYFESTPGQVMVANMWALIPVMTAPISFLGLKKGQRSRNATTVS